ncbi:MAG: sugar phosphate nucleotidyltransferase [Thermodesulfobacteriota bacterium]
MKVRSRKSHKSGLLGSSIDTSEGLTSSRWGVILAGGDGTRLRSLTKFISGDERPKQFCLILDKESLLDKTVNRAEISIPRGNILISLTRTHERFYSDLYDSFDRSRLVIQPANLGTAPAILYSLVRIAKADPGALIAFFPSDHYVSDDKRFMEQVESAFEGIEREPDRIVLLGITPSSAETEYGWIEPVRGEEVKKSKTLYRIKRFWEKPEKSIALELMKTGCLWNSFVMAGKVSTFLDIISISLPGLYHDFMGACDMYGTPLESDAIEYIYEKLTPLNFSQRVLEVSTDKLLVLAVKDIEWSDLGDPGRVLTTLKNIGIRADWTHRYDNLARKTG